MEASFVWPALETLRDPARAVEVAEPFPVFMIRKMRQRPAGDTLKPLQVFCPSADPVSAKRRVDCLRVHPPELEITFQLNRRFSERVQEV